MRLVMNKIMLLEKIVAVVLHAIMYVKHQQYE